MSKADNILAIVQRQQDPQRFKQQHWEGSFRDYLELVAENPLVARNAYQRIYDMILHYGVDKYRQMKQDYVHYKFFDDPFDNGKDAIFGLDAPIMRLVECFKSAAHGYGTDRRILLLHGPVGSSKSTIARLLKKGLEHYTATDAGALYTFTWHVENEEGQMEHQPCPMHEEPLKLIPQRMRGEVLAHLNQELPEERQIRVEGDLDPFCRRMFDDLLKRYDGDWNKVIEHVTVQRLMLSEKDRVGIGTFQPKDEKNQDSTELTGDINYRKIAEYGSATPTRGRSTSTASSTSPTADVRVHRGAQARRGLPVRPARRFAGAHDQAQEVRPDRHRRGDHRPHERARVQEAPVNELMEAFRDRTIKIDIPYNTASTTRSRSTRRTSARNASRASTSLRTRSRWPRCGRC
jgi:serine protein kinase